MVVDRLDVVVTQEKLFKIDRANVSFKISLILFDLRVIVFLTFLRTDSTREISSSRSYLAFSIISIP